jgi:hypothetical protein
MNFLVRQRLNRRSLFFATIASLATPSLNTSKASAAICDWVELFPGYPGYRGYITGLDSFGDYTCLEDLERRNPGFSRAKEDLENQTAAVNLGVGILPEHWTWENCLAIEAERGIPVTCYYCAIQAAPRMDSPSRSELYDIQPDPGDPRLLMGDLTSNYAVQRLNEKNDMPTWYMDGVYDADFRVLAGLYNVGKHINAEQALATYDSIYQDFNTPGRFFDSSALWDRLLQQGGYFPMPDEASPDDQFFGILAGVTMFRLILTDEAHSGLVFQIQQEASDWRAALVADPNGPTLGEWLREIAGNWV